VLLQVELPRRASGAESLIMEEQKRRFSEAGVNRRPSAAHILTEDTDSFIIGQRVYVDGVKPGRIQFIGETKFGLNTFFASQHILNPTLLLLLLLLLLLMLLMLLMLLFHHPMIVQVQGNGRGFSSMNQLARMTAL